MKLFGWRKNRSEAPVAVAEDQGPETQCPHPVAHWVPLHEDPTDPKRITGTRCGQCGELVPEEQAAES